MPNPLQPAPVQKTTLSHIIGAIVEKAIERIDAAAKRNALTPKAYPLLCDCIERGLEYGWNRAHKHTDTPDEHRIKHEMYEGVMNAICEAFDFPEPSDQG